MINLSKILADLYALFCSQPYYMDQNGQMATFGSDSSIARVQISNMQATRHVKKKEDWSTTKGCNAKGKKKEEGAENGKEIM